MAQFMDTGSGLPPTATPFSMDLATPIMAITQNMIKTRKAEIASDKTQISENEATILKALDFDVIKGMSDQLQQEHVKAVDELSNKWAQKFSQYQGKLPPTELLNLKHDQRDMETDIESRKANVLAFAKLQEEIKTNPNFAKNFDIDATVANMKNWMDKGKIGEPGAAFLAVPKQYTGAQITMRDYGDMFKLFKGERDEAIKNAAPGQVETITKSYGEKAEKMMQTVLSNPDLNTPEKIADAQRLGSSILGDVTVQKYNRGFAPQRDKGNAQNPQGANDLLERAYLHDQNAIQALKSMGRFRNVYFDDNGINPDTNKPEASIVLQKFDGGDIVIPMGTNKLDFKRALNEQLPTASKIKKDELIQENSTPQQPVRVETPYQFTELKGYLSDVKKKYPNPDLAKKDQKPGTEITGYDMAIRTLSDIMPEGWKVKKRGFEFGNLVSGNSSKDVVITDPSGNEKVFKYGTPEDFKTIQDFAEKNSVPGQVHGGKKEESKPEPTPKVDASNINTVEDGIAYLKTLPKFSGKTDDELRAIVIAHKK